MKKIILVALIGCSLQASERLSTLSILPASEDLSTLSIRNHGQDLSHIHLELQRTPDNSLAQHKRAMAFKQQNQEILPYAIGAWIDHIQKITQESPYTFVEDMQWGLVRLSHQMSKPSTKKTTGKKSELERPLLAGYTTLE